MTDEIDSKSLRRQLVLVTMASAFLIWQIPGMDFFGKIAEEHQRMIGLISLFGFVIWAGALVVLFLTSRIAQRGTSPEVAAAMEDELVRSNRSRAFIAGYVVSLATSALVFAISVFRPVTGIDAAHLILVAAVVAPMYAFVVLERTNA